MRPVFNAGYFLHLDVRVRPILGPDPYMIYMLEAFAMRRYCEFVLGLFEASLGCSLNVIRV